MQSFNTGHEDLIHDIQLDYFSKKLASCSSDRTIKIFDVSTSKPKLLEVLKGHEGPVWQISWAHPCFGTILASCSYDHQIFIWKEVNNVWTKIKSYSHQASVNSISWGCHEFGLRLFACSSDGQVSIASLDQNNNFHIEFYPDSPSKTGYNSICSSPTNEQFVTGGCDNNVYIWSLKESKWKFDEPLVGHKQWVRDAAWAPNIGLNYETIASCSQDGKVIIWQSSEKGKFVNIQELDFKFVVWKLSWSVTGNILAVTTSDNSVSLWKEGIDGKFAPISMESKTISQQQ